jgi:hypothetical protein
LLGLWRPCGDSGLGRIGGADAWARSRPGEDFTDSGQSVLELLNRVGADGWELADRQEHQERGDGPSYWDPSRTVTIYTFKNLVPG